MIRTFARRVKFTWDYFVLGRHRLPPLPDCNYPEVDETLMRFLAAMYEGHGASTVRVNNWIGVDGGRILTRAAYFNLVKHPNNLVLQVDFVTVFESKHHIIESFAGIGRDLPSALQDAEKGFLDCSFHALFSALLGHPCGHTEVEHWNIAGCSRRVTMGMMRTRGQFPVEQWPGVFAGLRTFIETYDLPSGLHWLRCFYSHVPGQPPTVEVLLDNMAMDVLQDQYRALPWPSSEEFYATRLFMIIQDKD